MTAEQFARQARIATESLDEALAALKQGRELATTVGPKEYGQVALGMAALVRAIDRLLPRLGERGRPPRVAEIDAARADLDIERMSDADLRAALDEDGPAEGEAIQ